tara:strand:+ start:208514 stop:208657 length:144 start_codon:yes stop_codon:yes gene_type:complete
MYTPDFLCVLKLIFNSTEQKTTRGSDAKYLQMLDFVGELAIKYNALF